MTEDLYRRYGGSVYRICLRYVNVHEDAQDMVHNVFIKVNEQHDKFRGDCDMFTWIYRITVNECLQLIRKRKRETRLDDEWLTEAFSIEDGSGHLETKLLLKNIFEGCDEMVKKTVLLLYYEGMKQEEAAELLKISRRTLNNRLETFQAMVREKGLSLEED